MELVLDKSIESVTSLDELNDWQKERITRFPLRDENFIYNTLPEDGLTHTNYLTYLEMCWQKHFNAIIRPDFIWHTITSEIALHIKDNAEKYRELFTDSDEKKEISVLTADPIVLPIDKIVERLYELVPFNAKAFMPEFSTTTENSTLAFGAALCDAMSPYYNYSMYLCGIPKIKVEGTVEDWKLLSENFVKICDTLDNPELYSYVSGVLSILDKIMDAYDCDMSEWFTTIIKLKKCGSGSEYLASGWITKLFMKQPSMTKTENFSSCVSIVEYKNLSTNKEYIMKVGLFSSKFEDEYLVPDFNYVVYKKD